MKKIYILITSLLVGAAANAQQIIDFENHVLASESFDNGSAGGGNFSFGGNGPVYLTNVYDTAWASWNGFSISNVTDNTTPGWFNQYSAFPGSGYDGSTNYAVFYPNGQITGQNGMVAIDSFKITNTTFSAISMRDGDAFAKQFGSPWNADSTMLDGTNGEDFFKVWIICESSLGQKDSIEFFLADYRFADNTQDYIVDDWVNIDISNMGFPVNKVDFKLESSDIGAWGMNTPAYFAIDNISSGQLIGVEGLVELNVSVYPNPATDAVVVKGESGELTITSLEGKRVFEVAHTATTTINVSNFSAGIYVIQLSNASGSYTNRLIVK
jgi:hypothetical protein